MRKSFIDCLSNVKCHQDNNQMLQKKSGYTKVARQINLNFYRPMRKTTFGVNQIPIYDTKKRIFNGKFEGQLGGMVCPPKNF